MDGGNITRARYSAAPSSACAAKVKMDDHEALLAAENDALFLRLGLPAEHRGGRSIQISASLAQRLHDSLQAAYVRGRSSGSSGGLDVRAAGRRHVFWGFENYTSVQASLNREEQRKWTTMLPVHEVEEATWRPLLYGGLDGFEELVALAKCLAGDHMLLACHLLHQGSLQACFTWHQDNRNNPLTKLSMVFLLSPGPSTMCVAGFEPFVYQGPGHGCCFPSEAHHRSGGSRAGTVKITFFFGDSTPPAAVYYARSLRGEW